MEVEFGATGPLSPLFGARRHTRETLAPDGYQPVERHCFEVRQMSECSKVRHAHKQAALAALRVIRRQAIKRGRGGPTGAYWCPRCRYWHLTSKSITRPAPWERTTGGALGQPGRANKRHQPGA